MLCFQASHHRLFGSPLSLTDTSLTDPVICVSGQLAFACCLLINLCDNLTLDLIVTACDCWMLLQVISAGGCYRL